MASADFSSVELAKNATIRVYVEHYVGNEPYISAIGSGFVVEKTDDGIYYIVTNRHVIASETVEDSSGIPHQTEVNAYIVYDNIKKCVPAKILAIHNVLDMAILYINMPELEREPIQIRSFEADELLGKTVYSIGFPAASDNIMSATSQTMLHSAKNYMTWAEGNVIRIIERDETDSDAGQVIQTNATINGGNSGGPLVDEFGSVVGICSFGATQGDNTYYAITSNELIEFLDENKINYAKSSNQAQGITTSLLMIGIAASAITIYLLSKLKKQKKKEEVIPAPAPSPAPVPSPTPAPTPVRVDSHSSPSSGGLAAAPMRELVCTAGALAGKRFRISGDLLIGRDPKRCQVVFPLDAKGVSAVHCKISFDGRQVEVTDQKSTCGTFIDGNKLSPYVPVRMHRGQMLMLGSERNAFLMGGNSGRTGV